MDELRLPENMKPHLEGMDWTRDSVGHSGAGVYRFTSPSHSLYLKVDRSGGELEREYRNLLWMRQRAPVPQVVAWAQDGGLSYLLMTEMPGLMTCDSAYPGGPPAAVSVLAQGMKLLHALDISGCPFRCDLDKQLEQAAENVRQNRVEPGEWEADNRFPTPQWLLEYLMDKRPIREELVFCHGDYCLPNIFGAGESLNGFIDVGRAGVADRWQDVALCIRSMRYNFGSDAYDALLLEQLGIPMDNHKLEYYILLDELF